MVTKNVASFNILDLEIKTTIQTYFPGQVVSQIHSLNVQKSTCAPFVVFGFLNFLENVW